MERLIQGTKVRKNASKGGGNAFCDFFILIKKGHEECGDSGFVYADEDKAIFGIFDGVSGEAGAASASSVAAAAILEHLRKERKASENAIREAVTLANEGIAFGLTTAAIAFVERGGKVILASVGDSPVYSIEEGKAHLELPIGRPVNDGDAIFKFLYYRNLVTSVLGPSGSDIHLNMRSGRLKKGQLLILATDGVTDNLFFEVDEGKVKESSGLADLGTLIGKRREPKGIVRHLAEILDKRIRGEREDGDSRILVPKKDDIGIIALRML